MTELSSMVWIELRKVLRSKMPFFTALGSFFLPLGIGFLIFIVRNPEVSRKLGLITAKADLMAVNITDWSSFMGLIAQMIAMVGFFLYCLITSWVFGREFVDGTLKDMLSVPVQRSSILLAKYVVVALWSGALTLMIFILSIILGVIIKLPQGSPEVILQGTLLIAVTSVMVFAVVTPFAMLASIGRGYLLPIGIAIFTLIAANVVVIAGWGDYFPWAIPGLYTQTMNSQSVSLAPVSFWLVAFTGCAGMLGTYLWWKFADQSH